MTILHTVKLTDHQKEILVRVFTAATPELAKAEIEFGEKEIAAGDVLNDLDAIEVTDKSARVTAAGVDLMRQQGILDDQDQLTKEVEQFKTGDSINVTDDVNIEQPDDMSDIDADLGGEMGDDFSVPDSDTSLDAPSDAFDDMKESLIQMANRSLIKECSMSNSRKNTQRKALKLAAGTRRRTFTKKS